MTLDKRQMVYLGGLFWIVICAGFVGSFVSHQPYTEMELSVSGPPKETVSETDTVIQKEEMSTEQYRFANAILSESVLIDEYDKEYYVYKDTSSVRIDGETYAVEDIQIFLNHTTVELDTNSYYQITLSTEEIGKYQYLTIFDLMFLLLVFAYSPLFISSLSKYRKQR